MKKVNIKRETKAQVDKKKEISRKLHEQVRDQKNTQYFFGDPDSKKPAI